MTQQQNKAARDAEYRKKKINFQEELTKYRERTESKLPYTIQQIEDVMFIDEKKIVSLEYITYTNKKDGRYHRLRKMNKEAKEKGLKTDERNNLGT